MNPDSLHTLSSYQAQTLWQQYVWIAITIVGLGVAYRQLRAASTTSLLQVEVMMFDYLRRIDVENSALIDLQGKMSRGESSSPLEVDAILRRRDGAIQNYLNSLDRFCGCILRGVIPKRQAKREYLLVVQDALTAYRNMDVNFDLHFPNIISIAKLWLGV